MATEQQIQNRMSRNWAEVQLRLTTKGYFSFSRCLWLLILVVVDMYRLIGIQKVMTEVVKEEIARRRSDL